MGESAAAALAAVAPAREKLLPRMTHHMRTWGVVMCSGYALPLPHYRFRRATTTQPTPATMSSPAPMTMTGHCLDSPVFARARCGFSGAWPPGCCGFPGGMTTVVPTAGVTGVVLGTGTGFVTLPRGRLGVSGGVSRGVVGGGVSRGVVGGTDVVGGGMRRL